MIHTVLGNIQDTLNQHLKNEFPNSNVKVVLSNLVNVDGEVAKGTDGNIVLFLVSINEETTLKNTLNRRKSAGQAAFAQKQPLLHLNFQLMFCANFIESNYVEGLTYLDSVLRFFHINPIIRLNTAEENEESNERLTFELCKLDYSELSDLWSAIGSKLMPSLVYKVRILAFDDAKVKSIVPSIKEEDQ